MFEVYTYIKEVSSFDINFVLSSWSLAFLFAKWYVGVILLFELAFL
jgi:hypothetical protein